MSYPKEWLFTEISQYRFSFTVTLNVPFWDVIYCQISLFFSPFGLRFINSRVKKEAITSYYRFISGLNRGRGNVSLWIFRLKNKICEQHYLYIKNNLGFLGESKSRDVTMRRMDRTIWYSQIVSQRVWIFNMNHFTVV